MIQHSKPWIDDADVVAVTAVLKSHMVGQGDVTAELERRIAQWVGVASPGIAVSSGAAALLLALQTVGVVPGDEVVLPTYVCPGVLEAVVAAGARPVLCDAGPEWVMTPDAVEPVLTGGTRAIIVPHLYGIYADVASFRKFGVTIIEDCAQALGGFGERAVAGDVAVFSFHPTKCLTTGEGGMIVARTAADAARARLLRDGDDRGARRLFGPLSNLASSLGLAQLDRYPSILRERARIARDYQSRIDPQFLSAAVTNGRSMFFRFPLRVPSFEAYERGFARAGITVRRGVDKLLHRLAGLPDHRFPVAVELFETTLSLPIYPALTETERSRCYAAAAELLGKPENRRNQVPVGAAAL